jgi:D-alanyl-D-alanine carboxypeptidase (penicillin-binding protein 5/6)
MTPTVNDLLRGMIAVSANDAAVALAEGVSGSVGAFVDAMNRQATAFGLKNTSFKNVTGVTEAGHRSTARDVAYIAARIIKDFPEYYPYYAIKEFRFNNITQPNRNLLLRRDPTVDGMKTGYTEAAGYCFIASAQRDMPNGKRRLLAVVMNTTSTAARANEAQKLLNWGYQAFDTVRLFDADKVIDNPPVWKGRSSTVQLGAAGAVYATVPRGEGDKLVTRFERTDPLVAPLAKGQRVGTLKVSTAAGTPVSEVPLLVLQPVEEAGVFGRAWDGLRLWIK